MSGGFPDGELTGAIEHVGLDDLVRDPVARVVVRSPEHTPERFLELVTEIGLHGVSYAVGWTAWLDLAPEGVTKASGLEQVRRALGVEPADTIAVGDGRNDIEMIRWAAHGAVMAQCAPGAARGRRRGAAGRGGRRPADTARPALAAPR